jgi:hypothetical protein
MLCLFGLQTFTQGAEIFRSINGPKKVHLYSQLSAVDIVESLMITKYAKLRPAYPLICGSKLDFTKNNSLVLCILQVDKFAHLPNVTPEFVEQDHYFSVLFCFTVGLKGLSDLHMLANQSLHVDFDGCLLGPHTQQRESSRP